MKLWDGKKRLYLKGGWHMKKIRNGLKKITGFVMKFDLKKTKEKFEVEFSVEILLPLIFLFYLMKNTYVVN